MKIILTSDWHTTKGLRTTLVLNYLDFLINYAKKENIRDIWVLGDIFDKSSNIKNEAFIPLFMKLLKLKEEGFKFKFIIGNHDQYLTDGSSIVETFEAFGKVYKEEVTEEIEGNEFIFLPYTKKEIDLPNKGQYLMTHLSIADFTFDNSYHVTEKHAFKKSLFEEFNFVFTGHFHRHQEQKNICYIGSPFQMNRGEIGQSKGFIILDTEIEKYEFIEYNEAPTYYEINADNIKDLTKLEFNNKIVVIRLSAKIKDFAKLRYIIFEKGAVDIIPIFETEEINDEIREIKVDNDIKNIVKDILNEVKEENIDNEELIKIFDKVLANE